MQKPSTPLVSGEDMANWQPGRPGSDFDPAKIPGYYGLGNGNAGIDLMAAPAGGWQIGPTMHTVQKGDTLSGINGSSDPASIGLLMARNGLRNTTIYPGQELVLGNLGDYNDEQISLLSKLGMAALAGDNARIAAMRTQADTVAQATVSGSGGDVGFGGGSGFNSSGPIILSPAQYAARLASLSGAPAEIPGVNARVVTQANRAYAAPVQLSNAEMAMLSTPDRGSVWEQVQHDVASVSRDIHELKGIVLDELAFKGAMADKAHDSVGYAWYAAQSTFFGTLFPGGLGEVAVAAVGGPVLGKTLGAVTRYAPSLPWVGEALGANVGKVFARTARPVPATPSYEELLQLASRDLDFSTKPNGAVFWSGADNMKVAQWWAKFSGKTTVEQTPGGRYLDELKLFENLDGKQAAEIWDIGSARFANGASGRVNAFPAGTARIGAYGERTWWSIERPLLELNPNVSNIRVWNWTMDPAKLP